MKWWAWQRFVILFKRRIKSGNVSSLYHKMYTWNRIDTPTHLKMSLLYETWNGHSKKYNRRGSLAGLNKRNKCWKCDIGNSASGKKLTNHKSEIINGFSQRGALHWSFVDSWRQGDKSLVTRKTTRRTIKRWIKTLENY